MVSTKDERREADGLDRLQPGHFARCRNAISLYTHPKPLIKNELGGNQ